MNFFEGTDIWTLAVIAGLTVVTLLTRTFFFFSSEEWALPDWAPVSYTHLTLPTN
jgi:branched-subunit amino acid transport protein